jgi:uncharacterized membrane protein
MGNSHILLLSTEEAERVLLYHPTSQRRRKRTGSSYILLPWREEVGRRGLSPFSGGPQEHDKLMIAPGLGRVN